jgi:glucose-1-phosphate thymidylyltransferase
MKIILPLAGLGTRLRPLTYTKPKPLVSLAGNTVLGHVLDGLAGLPIDEVIFITGYLGDQIETYVRGRYAFPARFIEQRELKGQAHALDLASAFLDTPVLIIFVDTLIKADLTQLLRAEGDGVLYVKEVEDPRRFGVAVVEDGFIKRLVEKPKAPVSNLAVVGFYYLQDALMLRDALRDVIERDIKTGGEYYLADALQLMVERGARLQARTVDAWEDCGTIDALLHTNRFLLDDGHTREPEHVVNSTIVPPVHIATSARIERSVVGPHVSIGEDAIVTDTIISDSIVGTGAVLAHSVLTASVIGDRATIRGAARQVNIGDDAAERG